MDKDLKTLAALGVPYAFIVSALSMYCYWRFVNINPFDFASVDSVLVQSLPAFLLASVMVVPAWLNEFIAPSKYKWLEGKKDVSGFVVSLTIAILFIAFFVLLLVLMRLYQEPRLYGVAAMALVICSILATKVFIMRGYFTNQPVATAAALIFFALPAGMIWSVADEARNILLEELYVYVEASELSERGALGPTDRMLYYGKLGDHIFFKVGNNVTGYHISRFKQLSFKRGSAKSKPASESKS